jgi:predicted transcriptional regulator YheO
MGKVGIGLNKNRAVVISPRDKQILKAMKPVVDGIVMSFGNSCEVALHSFENLDRSIIYIRNGHITGRSEGSPITGLGMKILKEAEEDSETITGCYYSKTTDGKTLRSVSTLIRNGVGKPIGMMCINFNMSTPLVDILDTFQNSGEKKDKTPENFVNNIDDLIKTTLRDTISAINSHNHIPNNEKNKTIVFELIKKGIFDIKGAIDIVARELAVSRYTIYNYIRENKFDIRKETE